jgi:Tat protein translocase TatC
MPAPVAPSEIPPELGDPPIENGSRMSFGDHLDELRTCLIRALLGLVAAAAVALVFGQGILALILRPLWAVQLANGLQPQLQALSPTDTFSAYLKISLLAGAIVAMPWLLYQGWSFVASGLYPHERKFVKRLTAASAGLFAGGVVFLYFLVLPVVLQFFISFNRAFDATGIGGGALIEWITAKSPPEPLVPADAPVVIPMLPADPTEPEAGQMWINTTTKRLVTAWGEDGLWLAALQLGAAAPAVDSQFAIPEYISFVLTLALAFGLAFETPIVVVFLAWSNLATTAAMRKARRYVIMVIVVAAAVITPTPDIISQLMLALPMYGLFELGLLMARGERRDSS